MRYRVKSASFTDRERVLTEISTFLSPFIQHRSKENPPGPHDYVYWWIDTPEVGDLVRANTSGTHPFTWGYVVALPEGPYGKWTIRDLVSENICYISNESFYALRGIPKRRLLWGDQRGFYIKVQKAVGNLGDFLWRFKDISFPAPRIAEITLRPHSWVAFPEKGEEYRRSFTMPFNSRTSIRAIEEQIRKHGPEDGLAWKSYSVPEQHAPR